MMESGVQQPNCRGRERGSASAVTPRLEELVKTLHRSRRDAIIRLSHAYWQPVQLPVEDWRNRMHKRAQKVILQAQMQAKSA